MLGVKSDDEVDPDILEIEEDLKEAKLQQLKKKVGDAAEAYYTFLENDRPFGYVPTCWDSFKEWTDEIVRSTQIFFDIYDTSGCVPLVGSKVNPKLNDCLMAVCMSSRPPTKYILHLLEKGADPNCHSKNYNTPLHWLARRGAYEPIKYLIELGADPTALNNRLRNPLMEACDSKLVGDQVKIVRLFLQQRCMKKCLEQRDSTGNSALINAIFSNNVWITRELLLAGALVTDVGIRKGLKDQNLYKYNIEMVFRMIQRKCKIEKHGQEIVAIRMQRAREAEERNRRMNPWDYSGALKVHHLTTEEQKARDKHRRLNKIKKYVERQKRLGSEKLNNWNSIRRDMADRIDHEFSHQLDNGNRNPHEWIINEKETTTAAADDEIDDGSVGKEGNSKTFYGAEESKDVTPLKEDEFDAGSISSEITGPVARHKFHSPKKTWKMVPKQLRSAYSSVPPLPDMRVQDITMEQLVLENLNNANPEAPVSLSPLTAQERYARQSGLEEVLSSDDDMKNFASFSPAFRRNRAADYNKFDPPEEDTTFQKVRSSYANRYSTPQKPTPTKKIATSDKKIKKEWKLNERDLEKGLGFINPHSKWAKRKLESDVVPPVAVGSGSDFNSSDSENDDPFVLF